MSQYWPDRWVFIDTGECVKIFASWTGGFATGEYWKLSSGCTEIKKVDDYYTCPQWSDSVYNLHEDSEGTTGYGGRVLTGILKDTPPQVKKISVEEAIELIAKYNQDEQ